MRAPILRLSLGLLCLGLTLPSEALAARKAGLPRKAPPPVAQPAPVAPQTAWTAAEPANCSRVRRKLWQADQGWLVKTVTVCH